MRERLIQYVDLLFTGAPDFTEIKQEILQNTLDRFDDLVSQGKPEEAAYRLAISGIGDINEILGRAAEDAPHKENSRSVHQDEQNPIQSRKYRAIAIAMYILSPVPLFILSEFGLDTMGLCFTLALVAAATYVILLVNKSAPGSSFAKPSSEDTPLRELKKSIGNVLSAVTLAVYLLLSFWTKAWFITWLIFPIAASIRGLINAILDLKEVNQYEN